ncbi:hypothetical protein HRG84_23070 [Flavisolibacter sp. BT320]|nr:hypothetical protein [Flavisolibacter longurius]
MLDSDFVTGNPRHKRWPIWAAWQPERLTLQKEPEAFLKKKKFACMVVSNPNATERIDFFHQLSKYKKVDSGGKYLNNIGGPVANKMEFISDYKFVLSFENSSHPGYTTEKLIEPMLANCIPVYWGNPNVGRDFNISSFIHVNGFNSVEKAIERIVELDRDENKFLQVVNEPWFVGNQIPYEMTMVDLEHFFDFIISDIQSTKPVAQSAFKSTFHEISIVKRKCREYLGAKLKL